MEGLPGIEALFREHKRLSCKLTVDELQAIRDFIEERLNQEQYALYYRLASLQNDFDITLRKSSEAITGLQLELNEKNEVLKHYRNSDENIINVHRQKEARWEKKQEILLSEIQKLDDEYNKTKASLQQAEKELAAKSTKVTEMTEQVEKATYAIQTLDEAKQVLEEKDRTAQDILKMKLEIDKRDRVIKTLEGDIKNMQHAIEQFKKDKEFNDVKVSSMQKELRRQVAEVATKCTELSELQFQLQLEKRQVVTLQKETKEATEDVQNYKRMLKEKERLRDPLDTIGVSLKKDLDIMDTKIRAFDQFVKNKNKTIKDLETRIENAKGEENLANQIKSEICLQGDSFLEKTVMELVKRLEEKRKKLKAQLKIEQMWAESKREAQSLTKEVSALQQQAEINRLSDIALRAADQVERIDRIMKHTYEIKMPRIFKVSARVKPIQKRPEESEMPNQNQRVAVAKPKSVFLTASTPNDMFVDNNYKEAVPTFKTRKTPRDKIKTARSFPMISNDLSDSVTVHSLSGSQMDLSARADISYAGNKSLKSSITGSSELYLPDVSMVTE